MSVSGSASQTSAAPPGKIRLCFFLASRANLIEAAADLQDRKFRSRIVRTNVPEEPNVRLELDKHSIVEMNQWRKVCKNKT